MTLNRSPSTVIFILPFWSSTKAFGDGKTQPVALRVARSVGADETFRKFFAVDVERAFGDVAESYAGGVSVLRNIEINAKVPCLAYLQILVRRLSNTREQSARVGKRCKRVRTADV